jgi:hypothetical protein
VIAANCFGGFETLIGSHRCHPACNQVTREENFASASLKLTSVQENYGLSVVFKFNGTATRDVSGLEFSRKLITGVHSCGCANTMCFCNIRCFSLIAKHPNRPPKATVLLKKSMHSFYWPIVILNSRFIAG